MQSESVRKTILVLDDIADYLQALARTLSSEWNVLCANSAHEARAVVERQRPDVALIDVRLSESDPDNREGLEILAWLRQRDASIPVVVMSAYQDSDATEEAMRLGARAFVKKPLDLRSLKALVAGLCES
ncbi:MAG: response regulator [Vicinamibacterales bacterium]